MLLKKSSPFQADNSVLGCLLLRGKCKANSISILLGKVVINVNQDHVTRFPTSWKHEGILLELGVLNGVMDMNYAINKTGDGSEVGSLFRHLRV